MREHLVHQFSHRLITLMKQSNLGSAKSKAGVKLNKLVEVSGCSHQMARRYVLGQALPDIDIICKIAKWLNVSPGWLLFGEGGDLTNSAEAKNLIQIEPQMLTHLLSKCAKLFNITSNTDELVRYIMDIINDVIHIEAEPKEIIKIIDMSINSIFRFHGINKNAKTKTS